MKDKKSESDTEKESQRLLQESLLKSAVIYSFRLPLSDGSFLFYNLRDDGKYVNSQGDEKTFEELFELVITT